MKAIIFSSVLAISMAFVSCQKDTLETSPQPEVQNSILPTRFGVDVPSSLSKENGSYKSANMTLKSSHSNQDDFSGNDIYQNLNTFIAVGESASEIVRELLYHMALFQINKPMSMTFISDDDQRTKNLLVTENQSYNQQNYEYQLEITDALSEGDLDHGIALVIYWNRQPIEAVAILKPYHLNRIENQEASDATFKIAYSEVANSNYSCHMLVEIAGLPLPDAALQPYAINNLKMYVGKKGEYVDVFGNSNHPNATFFTEEKGFSWSFVASGLDQEDMGVAEVGLPPVSFNSNSREEILEQYSIKQVITDEVNRWFINEFGIRPDANELSQYLSNADAPGYFDSYGFIQAGTAPNASYERLTERTKNLSPFNPAEVNGLSIELE